jgi:hypothetical protein
MQPHLIEGHRNTARQPYLVHVVLLQLHVLVHVPEHEANQAIPLLLLFLILIVIAVHI